MLCTTPDQTALLAELRRVSTLSRRLGMLVFTATPSFTGAQPEGNTFVSAARLQTMFGDADLRVVANASSSGFGPEPEPWRRQLATIDAELQRRHSGQPQWQVATRQSEVFGQLLTTGQIEGTLLVLEPATVRGSAHEVAAR